jgi:polyphosphate kinase
MRSAWDMQADGSYIQRRPRGDIGTRGCQEQLIDAANQRRAAAKKHKEKKVRNKLLTRFEKRLRESES